MATELSRYSTMIPVFCTCPFIVTTMVISSLALEDQQNVERARVLATM